MTNMKYRKVCLYCVMHIYIIQCIKCIICIYSTFHSIAKTGSAAQRGFGPDKEVELRMTWLIYALH